MVVNSNGQERLPLPGEGLFETQQIALWLQPIYNLHSGQIIHHEVLARWRDRHNHLHLPEAFLPGLAQIGMLLWFDRQVIRLAIERLEQDDELKLSVNLSEQTLNDTHFADYIRESLDTAQIAPQRLSFEITEKAIADRFQSALSLTQALNRIGCSVVIDNFTGRELSVIQSQQFVVDANRIDLVKVSSQIAQGMTTQTGEDLSEYLLEMRPILGQVVVKAIEDTTTLNWVKRRGFDGGQGSYLSAPDNEPRFAPFTLPPEVSSSSQSTDQPFVDPISPTIDQLVLNPEAPAPIAPASPQEPLVLTPVPIAAVEPAAKAAIIPLPQVWRWPWGRLLTASGFLGLGIAALAVGATSIAYRMSHFVVDGAVVNGRTVRLRAPIDGNITDFYAKPGIVVEEGQILARVERSRAEEQTILTLEGKIAEKTTQINAALQMQTVLGNQLQSLESRSNAVWTVDVDLSRSDLSQQQAAVDGAKAKAEAAQIDYQRYQSLAEAGAVSRQQADQLRATWEIAQAEVRQAEAILQAAATELEASRSRTLMAEASGSGFASEIAQLRQQMQSQTTLVQTLTAERTSLQQQLQQAQALYSSRQDLAVAAPLAGVIYRTDRERNEQVSQTEPLLTILDCQDLWVDVIVSTYDANQIDSSQPVKVELGEGLAPITGEIDLIQPSSSAQSAAEQARLTQVQALQLPAPPQLAGLPTTRLTIRIPPLPNHNQGQQFCGVGQLTRVTFTKKNTWW